MCQITDVLINNGDGPRYSVTVLEGKTSALTADELDRLVTGVTTWASPSTRPGSSRSGPRSRCDSYRTTLLYTPYVEQDPQIFYPQRCDKWP